MANCVVVKLKCRKCGCKLHSAKDTCKCGKPDVERVEIAINAKPGKRSVGVSSSP